MEALITGGAGFIGCNLAHRLTGQGHHVIVYDDLSREGVDDNVAWLRAEHGERWTLLSPQGFPGPNTMLVGTDTDEYLKAAANLLLRYAGRPHGTRRIQVKRAAATEIMDATYCDEIEQPHAITS